MPVMSAPSLSTPTPHTASGSIQRRRESIEKDLQDSWMIPFKHLKFECEVGRGSFGVVYRGEYLGTKVAIKKLLWNENESLEELRREFETEIKVMQSLRHPNILMFMGLSQNSSNELFIVTEFLEGGTLEEVLFREEMESWTIRVRICLEVARALGLMHEKNYIHRDLKWDNILLDGHKHVKVSDFGLSRMKLKNVGEEEDEDEDEEEKSGYCHKLSAKGEIWWRAPEVDRGDYDEKVDIFSFGMLVTTIIMTSANTNHDSMSDLAERIREHIFANMTQKGGEIIYGVDSSKLRELWPPECPQALGALAVNCCEYDPSKRPDIKEVVATLQALYDALEKYQFEVRSIIPSAAGADLWMSLAAEQIIHTQSEDIFLSSQKLVDKLDMYISKTTSVVLDFDHKEFLFQLLSNCSQPEAMLSTHNLSQFLHTSWGKVDLHSFGEFWRWFESCDSLLRNAKILPLWRIGFVKGFISSDKCRKLLKRRAVDGSFFIRFSRSSPGNLAITSYQDGQCKDILIFVEKSGFVPDTGSRPTLFFTLQDLIKRELDYLKFVYPSQSINNDDFTRAHDVISEQVRKERKSLRKDSGDYTINARRAADRLSLEQRRHSGTL
eukprot:TRINITY_DN201_c0_g1_i2.p1 TRINITY_DN201_c0_g1~~TRINITY_DN201_c0_g1_i2.p1  ORF type:complete len:609 (-),score=63.70 TRINITY_DN201_c0_g1_i2:165-1991(-)